MNPPEEKHTRPMAQEERLDRIPNDPDRLVSGSGSCSTPGQGTYSVQYPDTESTPGPDSTFERSGSWSGSCRFRARETRVGARDPMYRALGAWSGANRSEDSRPGREVAFPICAGPLGVSARMIRIISTPDRTPDHVRGKRGERPLQQGRSPLIFPCGKAVLEMIRIVRSGSCMIRIKKRTGVLRIRIVSGSCPDPEPVPDHKSVLFPECSGSGVPL